MMSDTLSCSNYKLQLLSPYAEAQQQNQDDNTRICIMVYLRVHSRKNAGQRLHFHSLFDSIFP